MQRAEIEAGLRVSAAGRATHCVDRALAYRALALVFRPPDAERLHALCTRELPELEGSLARLGAAEATRMAAARLRARLEAAEADGLRVAYERSFEPSGGLRCPPWETSHTVETPQHAMRSTFELADVAGFYRAFGVELEPGGERPDHVAVELEFMHLLSVKEAVAHAEQGPEEHAQTCHEAQRSFVRDHLGRFVGVLAGCLEAAAADPTYAEAGAVLEAFVAEDAARLDALPA